MKAKTKHTRRIRRTALVGAAMLAVACAVDQGAGAQAPSGLCITDAGPPTVLVDPVEDPDAFADAAEASRYYDDVVQEARRTRAMHQKALENLLQDPRWAIPDQRDALAIAVKQTLETIDGLSWREHYAAAQLVRMSQRG